jgi:hypothetical protein
MQIPSIEIVGIVLKIVIITACIIGAHEIRKWLRDNPTYSYAWVKKASAIILMLWLVTYVYLLVRTFMPMSDYWTYWFGAVIIRILVMLTVVVLAVNAKVRNKHGRR